MSASSVPSELRVRMSAGAAGRRRGGMGTTRRSAGCTGGGYGTWRAGHRYIRGTRGTGKGIGGDDTTTRVGVLRRGTEGAGRRDTGARGANALEPKVIETVV